MSGPFLGAVGSRVTTNPCSAKKTADSISAIVESYSDLSFRLKSLGTNFIRLSVRINFTSSSKYGTQGLFGALFCQRPSGCVGFSPTISASTQACPNNLRRYGKSGGAIVLSVFNVCFCAPVYAVTAHPHPSH